MTPIPAREATLARRSIAALLDLGLSLSLAAGLVLGPGGIPRDSWPPRYWNLFDYGVDIAAHHPELWVPPASGILLMLVLWETAWTRWIGAMPVARMLGLQVRTMTGRRPGWLRAFWRSLLGWLFLLPGAIGPAWSLLGRRRRALHDILSCCLVVRLPLPAEDTTPGEPEGPGTGESPLGTEGRTL